LVHFVGGLELRYTHRRRWKAEIRAYGRIQAVVPVTWTKARRQEGKQVYQEVWYKDPNELESVRRSNEPFVVAVALAKNYDAYPREFESFGAVFEVISTGKQITDESLETRVLRRLTNADFARLKE
jgi:hypothetical protein